MFKDPKGDHPRLLKFMVILIIVAISIVVAIGLLAPAIGNAFMDTRNAL